MSIIHWGEISEPPDPEIFTPDVSADIQKSMEEHCLDEYQDDGNTLQIENIVLPQMDPWMMYAISLHKYANNMTEMIRVAELAIETNLIPSEDAKPPIPTMPDVKLKHIPNNLNFLPIESQESTKNEVEAPELSEAIVRQLLIKCIATMFAHIGYETTFQSVFDILVDVLELFFIKICDRFVSALNEEEFLKTGGFPNVIERVLIEMGLGGAKGLYDYYQCRVLKYINILQKQCKELDKHYSALLIPKRESPTGDIGKFYKVKVKEEELDTDAEMHFTGHEGDVFSSEYQLLNSFEAVASMQGITDTGDAF